jgi:hypothetical protein
MPGDTAASGGAMTGGSTGSDTAMTGMSRDSGTTGLSHDTGSAPGASADSGRSTSGKANQSESGVTNTETKRSTLGPGATKTRPDQGQPVTSKGDTVNPGMDSTAR